MLILKFQKHGNFRLINCPSLLKVEGEIKKSRRGGNLEWGVKEIHFQPLRQLFLHCFNLNESVTILCPTNDYLHLQITGIFSPTSCINDVSPYFQIQQKIHSEVNCSIVCHNKITVMHIGRLG